LYRYTIFTGRVQPVLQISHCWHIPDKLDIAAMDAAAKMLVGTKDFKSFASGADRRENTVRTIFRCDVAAENDWVYVDVEGDSFLYNMVRNIVGTLVEVARDRWKPEEVLEILQARDRTAAGPLAPAAGLCLMRIEY
jgi:tRNA pseudouridine38-40 synthase